MLAALDLAACGFAVFPVHGILNGACTCGRADCKNAGKHPATPRGFLDAKRTGPDVAALFRAAPEGCNVGIATGAPSGVIVLDVDPRNGGDLSLERFDVPGTLHARTGGGGEHLFFKHPGGQIACSSNQLAPGLDVKADGGYVVAPPSRHASGRTYEWLDSPPWGCRLAPAPAWLLAQATPKRKPRDYWAKQLTEPVPNGERNVTIARLAGWMLRQGLAGRDVLRLALAANLANCKPPLAEAEVAKIVQSIARSEVARRGKA